MWTVIGKAPIHSERISADRLDALQSSFANLDGSLLAKLVSTNSIPVSITVPRYTYYIGFCSAHISNRYGVR